MIVSGAFVGLNNTLTTQAVMLVSPVERPVASAAYGFVRFIGGGLAPFAAARLAADFNVHVPFYLGAVTVGAAIGVLASGHRLLTRAEQGTGELPGAAGEPAVPAPAPIVVAVDASLTSQLIRHADCEVHLVPATPGPLRRATVARSS